MNNTSVTFNDAVERSFFVQYTALILIVLTFIIGSFISPHSSENISHDNSVVTASLQRGPELTIIEFDDIFAQDNKLVVEQLTALESLLLSHDIDAEISVYAPLESVEEGDQFNLALTRSISLYRHLRAKDIPVEALSVVARYGNGPLHAKASLTRSPQGAP